MFDKVLQNSFDRLTESSHKCLHKHSSLTYITKISQEITQSHRKTRDTKPLRLWLQIKCSFLSILKMPSYSKGVLFFI